MPAEGGTTNAVVFTGGDPPHTGFLARLARPDLVVAADAGLHHARRLGMHVDVVVGDFDSVDAAELQAAEQHGAAIERHPPAKDATDLELALETALRRGATAVTVVGGAGGRFDHFLANTLVLASERFGALPVAARIEAWIGAAQVIVIRDRAELQGRTGELVTLLPVGGPARGVTTQHLRYPLDGEDLPPGTTRGVSNEMLGPHASVELRSGVLLAIRPDALVPVSDRLDPEEQH
jgi:thiamine pyrophosphokinase